MSYEQASRRARELEALTHSSKLATGINYPGHIIYEIKGLDCFRHTASETLISFTASNLSAPQPAFAPMRDYFARHHTFLFFGFHSTERSGYGFMGFDVLKQFFLYKSFWSTWDDRTGGMQREFFLGYQPLCYTIIRCVLYTAFFLFGRSHEDSKPSIFICP